MVERFRPPDGPASPGRPTERDRPTESDRSTERDRPTDGGRKVDSDRATESGRPTQSDRATESDRPTGAGVEVDRLALIRRWQAMAGASPPQEPRDPRSRYGDVVAAPADLRRAGLAYLNDHEVTRYLQLNRSDRPWLGVAGPFNTEVRRIVAALDQSGGHTLQRHSPYGSAEMHRRRVEGLEDPAQADPALRRQGIDGIRGGEHYCAISQTRFTNAQAMTAALTRALRDPRVTTALETPYQPGHRPREVSIPIEELLGAEGVQHCEGFQLTGDPRTAKIERKAWSRDRNTWLNDHGDLTGFTAQPPRAERIPSFAGGTIEFAFRAASAREGYEINTFYPRPPLDPRNRETP